MTAITIRAKQKPFCGIRCSAIRSHFNFDLANKTQKKYSPLYLKQIAENWQSQMSQMLPEYVDQNWPRRLSTPCRERCRILPGDVPADGAHGRNSHRTVERSGISPRACDIADFFVDVPYEGETVRARCDGDT